MLLQLIDIFTHPQSFLELYSRRKTVNGTKEPVIYYHMQEGMTTWQAGDGGNLFSLLDTGVAHKGRPNPKVTIGEDRYFYLNGERLT